MKEFLRNTKFKLNLSSEYVLWDFQHILYVLLQCLTPEELMTYLDIYYREDLTRIILPEMHSYSYLRMSDQPEINMKNFITAFLLEEAAGPG